MSIWSLDLGSSNSAIARWDKDTNQPTMVHLPEICRVQESNREIEVKYAIPSAVLLQKPRNWKDKLGAMPFIEKRVLMGKRALIGNQAIVSDRNNRSPDFAPCFKPFLMRSSFRTLARLGDRSLNARQVAKEFLRELLAEIQRVTGERPRQLTVGTPVDCYEPYRAELKNIGKELGITKLNFIDEPVAAALGYGLSGGHRKPVLVIDFGAGTLDLALISMAEADVNAGRCRVLAKDGAMVGGNAIDSWLMEEICEQAGYDSGPSDDPSVAPWFRAMLDEARALKERLFFEQETHFFMEPPETLRQFDRLMKANSCNDPVPFSRDQLITLLERKGLYTMVENLLDSVLADAASQGVLESGIGDVLLVGGSTLLPGIYPMLEKRFGRDRVRAWQPFHAVAYGGAVFASGHLSKSDFITHDYAFRTYNPKTHEAEYQTVIPRGTGFPTPADLWKRQLIPTCALGEAEKVFKLVVCELGRRRQLEQEFVWDPSGRLHALDERDKNKTVIIPLNEENPTLGFLDPPHEPDNATARLEIGFGVNKDRWLVATVFDLVTRKALMKQEPVIRIK